MTNPTEPSPLDPLLKQSSLEITTHHNRRKVLLYPLIFAVAGLAIHNIVFAFAAPVLLGIPLAWKDPLNVTTKTIQELTLEPGTILYSRANIPLEYYHPPDSTKIYTIGQGPPRNEYSLTQDYTLLEATDFDTVTGAEEWLDTHTSIQTTWKEPFSMYLGGGEKVIENWNDAKLHNECFWMEVNRKKIPYDAETLIPEPHSSN